MKDEIRKDKRGIDLDVLYASRLPPAGSTESTRIVLCLQVNVYYLPVILGFITLALETRSRLARCLTCFINGLEWTTNGFLAPHALPTGTFTPKGSGY